MTISNPKQRTILVVDDSTSVRRLVVATLQAAGYQTLEGDNGATALRHLDGQRIDMIISDVNMGVMDGIEFTRRVRRTPGYDRTPLVMFTTESSPEMKDKGRLAGATGWMVKPFHPDTLLKVVTRVLPQGS